MIHSIRQRQPMAQDEMDLGSMLKVFATEVISTGQTIGMMEGWAAVTLKLNGNRLYIGLQTKRGYELAEPSVLNGGAGCKFEPAEASSTGIPGEANKLGRWYALNVNPQSTAGYRLIVRAQKAG